MWRLTGWAVAFLLAFAVGSTTNAATLVSAPSASAAAAAQGGVPQATGRLKFKSAGPVCMCAEGLSERDIEQALAKAKPAVGADSGSSRNQSSSQEKNINLGVLK